LLSRAHICRNSFDSLLWGFVVPCSIKSAFIQFPSLTFRLWNLHLFFRFFSSRDWRTNYITFCPYSDICSQTAPFGGIHNVAYVTQHSGGNCFRRYKEMPARILHYSGNNALFWSTRFCRNTNRLI
jgi:hypothetical protein